MVFHITLAIGLMAAAPFLAEAGQLFLVQTPSANGSGTCFDPILSCSLAGLLGTDTALNSGGRVTDFTEFGQTGPIPPGVNIFAHIAAGQTAETVTIIYSIDGLQGGEAWSQLFSAILNPGDSGQLKTYLGSSLGATTTLLATQALASDDRVSLSGTFDFGPGPYAITQVLVLNLRSGASPPDYGRLLETPGGFYYGTFAVTTPEPGTFLLLSLGLLVSCGKLFRRRTRLRVDHQRQLLLQRQPRVL
jgi:hypothetical protein